MKKFLLAMIALFAVAAIPAAYAEGTEGADQVTAADTMQEVLPPLSDPAIVGEMVK